MIFFTPFNPSFALLYPESCHHQKENYHWSVSHFPNISSYPSSFSYIWYIHFNRFPTLLRPPFCWPHHPLFFHQHPFLSSYPFMSSTYFRVHVYHSYCVKICSSLVPPSLPMSIKTSNLYESINLCHHPFPCLHINSWTLVGEKKDTIRPAVFNLNSWTPTSNRHSTLLRTPTVFLY